jgi:hypothetical protein
MPPALQNHPKMHSATLELPVQLWLHRFSPASQQPAGQNQEAGQDGPRWR